MASEPRDPAPSVGGPTGADRLEIVDIVRGFALFGVLVANMVWTTQLFATSEEQMSQLPSAPVDTGVSFGVLWLISYKFYSLFSVLFGLGFALQMSRLAKQGASGIVVFRRRLIVLFVLGALHATLLWFGDILHIYALLGFALLLFRDRSDRAILGWAALIAGVMLLMPVLHLLIPALDAGPDDWDSVRDARYAAMAGGSYADVLAMNTGVQVEVYSTLSFRTDQMPYWYLSVFWKFLVGLWLGRRLLAAGPAGLLPAARRIAPWALSIGLIVNFVLAGSTFFFDAWIPDASTALLLAWFPLDIGIAVLSLGYACLLLVLHEDRPAWRHRIGVLAPVGRMALTNYLAHSALFVLLFYGIGTGLLGRVGTAGSVLMCLIIFAAQIELSAWWLRRFRFGPMEWLWRSLTYGRAQPMRRTIGGG